MRYGSEKKTGICDQILAHSLKYAFSHLKMGIVFFLILTALKKTCSGSHF